MKRSVKKKMTLGKDTWYSLGVLVVSDGWTNQHHHHQSPMCQLNGVGYMNFISPLVQFMTISYDGWTIKKNPLIDVIPANSCHMLRTLLE